MDDDELFRRLQTVSKPGFLSREQAEKAAFTSELIKALEAADAGRNSDRRDLAGAAFGKLQYDFPVRAPNPPNMHRLACYGQLPPASWHSTAIGLVGRSSFLPRSLRL